ncbi:MAG: phospholipase A, partial [Haliea sp.]|nr:phospholipase A [Haliea sp.]
MKPPNIFLLLALVAAAQSKAHAENCVSIADDQSRLACYDAAAGRSLPDTADWSLGWGADGDDTGLEEEAVVPVNLAEEELLFGKRIAEEAEITGNAWVITPHHRNYLLPLTYSDTLNRDAWALQQPDEPIDRLEAKFQLSLKTIAWENILGHNNHLWVGYTQRNWWQLYNESSPFRETNYQPEISLSFTNNWRFLGFTNTLWDVGFVHESNGQAGDLSRSWNRIIAGALVHQVAPVPIP